MLSLKTPRSKASRVEGEQRRGAGHRIRDAHVVGELR